MRLDLLEDICTLSETEEKNSAAGEKLPGSEILHQEDNAGLCGATDLPSADAASPSRHSDAV